MRWVVLKKDTLKEGEKMSLKGVKDELNKLVRKAHRECMSDDKDELRDRLLDLITLP